jgi:hypothetical protein
MSLKGQFSWYSSLRRGGHKAITFTLTCTNLLQSEDFDAVLVDGSGQIAPLYYRGLSLKARNSFRFDLDSCGWDWCQNDFFAIIDEKNNIKERWDLRLPQYAPGECPECHGTHRCGTCQGKGYVQNIRMHTIETCPACGGTGICQTCYIPIRSLSSTSVNNNPLNHTSRNVYSDRDAIKQRQVAQLRQRISELQEKVRNTDWELKMMDLKDQNVSMRIVYNSKLELKYRYNKEIINLQSQLEELEMQGL